MCHNHDDPWCVYVQPAAHHYGNTQGEHGLVVKWLRKAWPSGQRGEHGLASG